MMEDEEDKEEVKMDSATIQGIKKLIGKEESTEPISKDIKVWFKELDKRLFIIVGMVILLCILCLFVGLYTGSASANASCNEFWQEKIKGCTCYATGKFNLAP